MTVEALKAAAKSDAARKHRLRFRIRTGWAMHGNVRCAFYPDSHRWAYFLPNVGRVNRADVEPLLGGSPMTANVLLAIDPGAISGAGAFLFDDFAPEVFDLPVADGQVDAVALTNILAKWGPGIAVVERVASMPKQGVASTFKFGMAVGLIHGVLLARRVPVHLVTPGVWKKHYNLGPDKEQARALAIRLYPGVNGLDRKKDAGRAEALLLGRYWLEKNK